MAEAFLQISPEEQAEILQTCAGNLGRRAEHLEKDVWICWVLQGLFTMPSRLPMAFKGGTWSGRQGCKSRKVEVLFLSIACIRTDSISGACRGNEAR